MRRIIVPRSCLEGEGPGASARLDGALHHHLVHVLRLGRDAPLLLVDGEGSEHRGRIVALEDGVARVLIEESRRAPAVAGARLTLVYGVSRRARTEWVLQKATELGADRVLLAQCRRSVARPEGERRQARWEEIVRQAGRQSRRATLPTVVPPQPLVAALATAGAGDEPLLRLLAHAGGQPFAALDLDRAAPPRELALAVGPEGGFAEEEVAAARALGFAVISLGPQVLRTETAAVVLLTLAAFLGGRLEGTPPGD